MTIITITGGTPETKSYDPCTFYVTHDYLWNTPEHPDGRDVVISESPTFGAMLREDMTREKVLEHAKRMEQDGFTVTTVEVNCDGRMRTWAR